jgi:chromosome segregation ATPase
MDKEKREAYIEKLAVQLKEWNAQIDGLMAKAEKAKTDAGTEYARQIENLNQKKETATKKLEELKGKGEGAWEDIAAGIEKVPDDLKVTFDHVKTRFK